jgi:hypothetical protein
MKKTLILIILSTLFSCSKDEENSNSINTLNLVSPNTVRISDTITITGENMSEIRQCKFVTRFNGITVYPIEQSDNMIKVIVPAINDEEFDLYILPNSNGYNNFHFNLIGTFPLPSSQFFNNKNIGIVKMINENIAFITVEKQIFKTTDGGYNWIHIKTFDHNIQTLNILNENQAWASTFTTDGTTNYSSSVHFTNDGWETDNEIFSINEFGKSINQIYFSSTNSGYVITSKGEIYETTNNQNFNLVYDCPYSNSSNYAEYDNITTYNNTLLSCGHQSNTPGYIKKINNTYDYIFVNGEINKMQLIDETKAYKVMYTSNGGQQLYFSNNLTDWNLTNNFKILNFHFINQNMGIGISANSEEYEFYETLNGGQNWTKRLNAGREFGIIPLSLDFFNKKGIITGTKGKLWKHIFE